MHSIFLIPLVFGVNALATLLNRQYPHLIIPVDKRTGDFVPGTKTSGDVEHAVSLPCLLLSCQQLLDKVNLWQCLHGVVVVTEGSLTSTPDQHIRLLRRPL